MAEVSPHDEARVLRETQIHRALGTFLVIFGLVVLVSIGFTDTGIGKLTDLGAGAVITGIGAAMVYKARRLRKRR
jgi:uncharacterized membrane protein